MLLSDAASRSCLPWGDTVCCMLRNWLPGVLVRLVPLFAVLALIPACRQGSGSENDRELTSIHHFSEAVLSADQKRNTGDYASAGVLYDSLATTESLSKDERVYVSANSQLCHFLANDTLTVGAANQVPSATDPGAEVSQSLLRGIVNNRNGRSGLADFYRAGALLRADGKEETFEYFVVLEQLAWCHQLIHGETDSSYYYYKQAFDMAGSYEQLSPHAPRLLAQLAEVAITNRDFVASLGYTEDGLRRQAQGKDRHNLLILKATLFRRMEKFDSAAWYYQQAEGEIIASHDSLRWGKLLRELALHEMIVDNDTAFLVRMRQLDALPARYAATGEVSADRLWGFYHFLRGNVQESIDAYERAVGHFSKQKVPDIVQAGEAYWVLAHHYRGLGQYEKAEENVFSWLVYFSPYRDAPFSWELVTSPEVAGLGFNFVNYQQLAEIELARYKSDERDWKSLERSYDIYQLIDSLMFQQIRAVEEDALLMFLRVGRWVYSGAVEASYLLHQSTDDPVFLNQAHHWMERSKGLITYQDLLARQSEYFVEVPEAFRDEELKLKAQLAAMKRSYAYNSPEMLAMLRKADDYYDQMQRNYPTYYNARYELRVGDYEQFAAMSGESDMTIVQYFITPEYVYMLTYGKLPQLKKVALDSAFTSALESVQQHLSLFPQRRDSLGRKAFMAGATLLYQKLIAPLSGLAKSLLIVPDAELAHLPFEVLMEQPAASYRDAPYLILSHDINYTPSLQVYELGRQGKTGPVQKIVAYSFAKSNGTLDALPGTKREIAWLQKVFASSSMVVRSDDDITPENLISDFNSEADIIHLGLHAASSLKDRLENRIDCFRKDSEGRDAVYGYEIAPLSVKAHTVVLTACQSALGPVAQGEGTYSLARAFKQAGVRNVVASLWNVPDGTMASVVGPFYEGIKEGKSSSGSLSMAKRKYLQNADELTAHPHFWAGLTCQGQ